MSKIDTKSFKKKKILAILVVILSVIAIIVAISLYLANMGVREWVDQNILGKNLTEEDIQTINLSPDKSNQVHVYSDNIAILNDKTIKLYNSFGEEISSIEVNINTAIFASCEKYFAIAEKDGQSFGLILDKTYLWDEKIEGQILQIYVNQHGYVAVVSKDITHKSILSYYNPEGKKLFTRYFFTTQIVDASISKDNKYIAVGEIDTSGTIVQSNIIVISTENAQNNPDKTITYTYKLPEGDLLASVKYQEKDQICFSDDKGLKVIKNEQCTEIINTQNEKISFIANDLKNQAVYVEEERLGLLKTEIHIHILDTFSNKEITYNLTEIAKEIYTNDNIIAINTGTEVYFINSSGWLIKKYTERQEITNIKFSNDLATLVYKDKIIIIDL